jgi:hypothetical protein
MPRPVTRHVPRPLTLEILERHTFTITDRELADQVRQALEADDREHLDTLLSFVTADLDATTTVDSQVVECREVLHG